MKQDEIVQLEGVALAEAVARDVMGWHKKGIGVAFDGSELFVWCDEFSRHKHAGNFRPDTDHNHAAEVREKVSQMYGKELRSAEWCIVSGVYGKEKKRHRAVTLWVADPGEQFRITGESETVAICRVSLLAKAALETKP